MGACPLLLWLITFVKQQSIDLIHFSTNNVLTERILSSPGRWGCPPKEITYNTSHLIYVSGFSIGKIYRNIAGKSEQGDDMMNSGPVGSLLCNGNGLLQWTLTISYESHSENYNLIDLFHQQIWGKLG